MERWLPAVTQSSPGWKHPMCPRPSPIPSHSPSPQPQSTAPVHHNMASDTVYLRAGASGLAFGLYTRRHHESLRRYQLSLLTDPIGRGIYPTAQERGRPLYGDVCHIQACPYRSHFCLLPRTYLPTKDGTELLKPSGTYRVRHRGLAPSSVPRKHASTSIHL